MTNTTDLAVDHRKWHGEKESTVLFLLDQKNHARTDQERIDLSNYGKVKL
jgi:hypothetical protein